MTPDKRIEVVATAMQWQNTPYHHQGNLKGVGVDCVMLMVEIYKACGVIPPQTDPRPYAHDWHTHRNEELYLCGLAEFAEQVEVPEPGDIALFKFGRCVSHGAIVMRWPLVMHAYLEQGAVVQTDVSRSAALCRRLHSFYTLKDC